MRIEERSPCCVLTEREKVVLMILWGEAAKTSLRGPPDLWRSSEEKNRDRDVSKRRHRKKSMVGDGNFSANFSTGSLKGLPSWKRKTSKVRPHPFHPDHTHPLLLNTAHS